MTALCFLVTYPAGVSMRVAPTAARVLAGASGSHFGGRSTCVHTASVERALAIVAIVLLAACGATQRQGSERSRRIRAAKSAAWLQAAHESDDRYFVAKLWGAVLLCDGFYPAMAQLGRSDEIERLCAALPGERRRDAPPDEQGPIGVRVRRIFCGGVAGPSGPGQVYREQRLCRGRHGWVELLVPY